MFIKLPQIMLMKYKDLGTMLSKDEMKNVKGGFANPEWCSISCAEGPHQCIRATCVFHDTYSACVSGGVEIFTCGGVIEV
jgi:hypothetical protein